MLVAHDLLRGLPLCAQALFQPAQCRRDPGILIAEPLHQLHHEGRLEFPAQPVALQRNIRLARRSIDAQQPIGHRVGLLARVAIADDA